MTTSAQSPAKPSNDSIMNSTNQPRRQYLSIFAKFKNNKSRQPANTAFLQQQLKAWQPILTPKSVIPLLFVFGIVFIPIGAILLRINFMVERIWIDYSNCFELAPLAPAWHPIPPSKISRSFKESQYGPGIPETWQRKFTNVNVNGYNVLTPFCSIQFDVTNDLTPPIFLYYRLTHLYQNHRRYVKSFDQNQLIGHAVPNGALSTDCEPLKIDRATNKPFYPCGLIANSFFNDSFSSPILTNTRKSSLPSEVYYMRNKDIAFPSFKPLFGVSAYKPQEVVPPPNWRRRYSNGYSNETGLPNLHEDENFQVWMRTASWPMFSKLVRHNDTTVMVSGRYQINIEDYFPATSFGGTKSFMLTTTNFIGGSEPYLAIAYLVAGGLCIFLALAFYIANFFKPRRNKLISFSLKDAQMYSTRSLQPFEG